MVTNNFSDLAKELGNHIGFPKEFKVIIDTYSKENGAEFIISTRMFKDITIGTQIFLKTNAMDEFVKTYIETIENEWKECKLVKDLVEVETQDLTNKARELLEENSRLENIVIKLQKQIDDLKPYENYYRLTKEMNGGK